MSSERTEGIRFSMNYLQSFEYVEDCPRARLRICKVVQAFQSPLGDQLAEAVEAELGIFYPPVIGAYYPDHPAFFTRCLLRDLLDTVTIAYGVAANKSKFVEDIRAIFAQERLRFRIDDEGGVHPLIDEIFEATAADAVNRLVGSRFKAASDPLRKALEELSKLDCSGKLVIKCLHESVETVCLNLLNKTGEKDILSAALIKNEMRPLFERYFSSLAHPQDYSERFISSFLSWVNLAHPFRHGTVGDVEHEAPLEFTYSWVQQGLGLLRFLVALAEMKTA